MRSRAGEVLSLSKGVAERVGMFGPDKKPEFSGFVLRLGAMPSRAGEVLSLSKGVAERVGMFGPDKKPE